MKPGPGCRRGTANAAPSVHATRIRRRVSEVEAPSAQGVAQEQAEDLVDELLKEHDVS
jgi:hypothetical protein